MHESVEQLPDSDSAKQALLEAIDREITLLEAAKGDSQKLAQQLKDASTQVTQDTAAAERSRKEILNRITSAKQSISNVRDDYATNVKPKIDALASTVSTLISQTDSMITQLSGTADDLDDVTGDSGDECDIHPFHARHDREETRLVGSDGEGTDHEAGDGRERR